MDETWGFALDIILAALYRQLYSKASISAGAAQCGKVSKIWMNYLEKSVDGKNILKTPLLERATIISQ